MTDRIHLSRAHVTQVEEDLVVEALRSGWVAPLGPMVDRFEAAVAARVGVSDALALSSGTAALHLALLHHGCAPGRVVVLPSMTFAASANAVLYTGATPVFVDSLTSDANVDPALLLDTVAALRREGVDVAAAMTVDLFGRCADNSAVEAGLADALATSRSSRTPPRPLVHTRTAGPPARSARWPPCPSTGTRS